MSRVRRWLPEINILSDEQALYALALLAEDQAAGSNTEHVVDYENVLQPALSPDGNTDDCGAALSFGYRR